MTLDQLRALPEVSATPVTSPPRHASSTTPGGALRSQMLGRAWIEDDALNFDLVEERAPGSPGRSPWTRHRLGPRPRGR
ncbi:MAG: hypothetical protein R2716_08835 [Microthrixaceae bacterium]